MSQLVSTRRLGCCLMAAAAALLPSCAGDGQLNILGYSTAPNYDPSIRTVHVPIFQNLSFRQGLEFDLTRAVIREIEAKTPFKVVSGREGADTELTGKIIGRNKTLINFNQLGEIREAETTLSVEVVWRDLRPGHHGDVLSRPQPPRPGEPPPPPGSAPPPVLVQSLGSFIPELGGSLTTSEKQNVDRLAVQVVSMMEKPW